MPNNFSILEQMKEMGFEQDAIDYAEIKLKENDIEYTSKLMELMMTLGIGNLIFKELDENSTTSEIKSEQEA
jgi:hypothetical protein